MAAIVWTLWTPSSQAALVTLNDGGVTKLEVVARDRNGNPSLINQIENLFPASMPFDGSHVATQGGSHSEAAYHLGLDGFTITSSGARAGSLDSRANVQPVIFFSVSVDTPYNITGTLSVDDPGLTGKAAGLTATLTDLTTSGVLFHSDQGSFGVVDLSFALGGTAGNQVNELSGSPTGLLLAGHQYRLFYGTSIYAANSGDPASFVGTFNFGFAEQNQPPVANDKSVTTDQDTPVNITLTATDADGDSLTFQIVTLPAHGMLSGTAPDLTYTPDPGFTGQDSFTFKANDGQADSNIATVGLGYSAQAANLIHNGSFESPVIPTNSRQVITPTSWTVGVNAVMQNGNGGNLIDPIPPEGQQCVSVATSAAYTLSQVFTVTSGMQYTLRWFDGTAHEAGQTQTAPYSVAVLTDTLQTVASASLAAFHPEDWRERSLNMTLSPGTYTLRFTPEGIGPGGLSAHFDNVSLEASSSPTTLEDFLYFTKRANPDPRPSIMRVKTDGSGLETVFQNATERAESGIALDVSGGHLYSGSEAWLYRLNLDGSGRVNLVPVINPVQDVELDLVHGKIYWSEGGQGRNAIRCANLDGTDARTFIDVGTDGGFTGLAVDPYGGKLYFIYDVSGNDTIQSMNLDGSGQSVLYNLGGPGEPGDLEIDLATGTLYFNPTRYANPGIYKAPADGSGPVELVVPTPDGEANGLHYDPVDHKFYSTHVVPAGNEIRSVNIDGTDVRTMAQYSGVLYWYEVGHGIIVTGNDTEPPSITCPGNMTVQATGPGGAAVTFTPTATDNFPGVSVVCNPASGTVFPIGTTTVTCTATDGSGNTSSCSFTVTVTGQVLTGLGPTQVWIGLKNSDDVGTKFDVLAEIFKNGSLVGSGQLNSVPGGSSGFNNAVLRTINTATNVVFLTGDTLSFKLSVRIAVNVSGHSSGTARLWFNDSAANSRFNATVDGAAAQYFLLNNSVLGASAGPGPKKTIDVLVNKNVGGNPFKPFGTWSKTF